MPDFLGAFYFYTQDVLQTRDGSDASIEIFQTGNLVLTSGKIVACDGLIPSIEPFSETVEPGSYPVILSMAQVGNKQPRVACAMLRIKEKGSGLQLVADLLTNCLISPAPALSRDQKSSIHGRCSN